MNTPQVTNSPPIAEKPLETPLVAEIPLSAPSLTPAQVTVALAQAKDTHRLVIEWVRSFDAKIGPLLTADGALVAACVAILGQQTSVLTPRPVTQHLLEATLLPLLFSLLMAISSVSPSLKRGRWGSNQHKAEKLPTGPTSVLYFGQIALHESSEKYAQAAKTVFVSENDLLEDLLQQTYVNAQIASNKSSHVAWSARGLFIALMFLVICGLSFIFGF